MATNRYYSKTKLAAAQLVLKCYVCLVFFHQRSLPVPRYSVNSEYNYCHKIKYQKF